ncbi:3'(2'),5'-bisphosphate nucleotidase 1 isoform X2 [Dermacentor variabilis]|uniref:3'(2'),5'-bisphosphate nucleotidase 1 isoform X2 n=1 Tax=Dermacentor variabilis TaxID=34621 RepID=UPI003F5B392C
MASCGAAGTGPLVLRVISNTVKIVNSAGKIIKDIMNSGNLGIVEKEGINDLQTEADRSVQRCIVTSLSQQFPKLTIIGEETLEEKKISDDWIITDHDKDVLSMTLPDELKNVKEEDLVVWVDPLDGTKEYTQGFLDHVTILVGIAVQGKAVGGVIHQPYYNYQGPREHEATARVEKDVYKQGRTMWGIVGVGAFGIKRTPPPAGKRIITTTRSHSSPVINSCIESMKPDEVLRVGGAGHKVLLLIEGKAHAYVFPSNGCKKWDTCAPEAILHATGGLLTDIHGNRLQYHKDVEHVNGGGVLATCLKEQHEWFKNHIPPDVAKTLPVPTTQS